MLFISDEILLSLCLVVCYFCSCCSKIFVFLTMFSGAKAHILQLRTTDCKMPMTILISIIITYFIYFLHDEQNDFLNEKFCVSITFIFCDQKTKCAHIKV